VALSPFEMFTAAVEFWEHAVHERQCHHPQGTYEEWRILLFFLRTKNFLIDVNLFVAKKFVAKKLGDASNSATEELGHRTSHKRMGIQNLRKNIRMSDFNSSLATFEQFS
jgi:hypothetical protein